MNSLCDNQTFSFVYRGVRNRFGNKVLFQTQLIKLIYVNKAYDSHIYFLKYLSESHTFVRI